MLIILAKLFFTLSYFDYSGQAIFYIKLFWLSWQLARGRDFRYMTQNDPRPDGTLLKTLIHMGR